MSDEEPGREKLIDEFRGEVQSLIDRWWDRVGPVPDEMDDPLDAADVAEMGQTFPAAWVLLVEARSLANPDAVSSSTRYTASGQSPFTGIGLLYDQLQLWSG